MSLALIIFIYHPHLRPLPSLPAPLPAYRLDNANKFNVSRQNILRATRFLDHLFYALQVPVKCLGMQMEEVKTPGFEELAKTQKLLYQLITFSLISNPRNEEHFVRRRMDVASMTFLGSSIGTASCLSVLFDSNLAVLEQGIDDEKIKLFITMIARMGPRARFLRLLASICAAGHPKTAVVSNQEAVLRALEGHSAFRSSTVLTCMGEHRGPESKEGTTPTGCPGHLDRLRDLRRQQQELTICTLGRVAAEASDNFQGQSLYSRGAKRVGIFIGLYKESWN